MVEILFLLSEFLLFAFRISAFPPIFQIVLRGRRNCLTVLRELEEIIIPERTAQ